MSLGLDQVTFQYADGPVILDAVSLAIPHNSYTLVRGPSGAGKSTLLRLFSRLEEPQSGHILFHGAPCETVSPPQYRRSVAYMQQMPSLISGTIRDNLLLPFTFKANSALSHPDDQELQDRLKAFLLDCFSLDTRADTLSVGQAQRLCFIRSLLLEPEVILLDEPTASLDADSAAIVLEKTVELHNNGMTVLMISHSEQSPPGVTHTLHFNKKKLELS